MEVFWDNTFSSRRLCAVMIKSSPLAGICQLSRLCGSLRLLSAVLIKLWSFVKSLEVNGELAVTLNSGGQPKIKIRFVPFIIGY